MPNSLFSNDLRGEYDTRVLDVRERRTKAHHLKRALVMAGLWNSPVKILDVGCGSGLILDTLDASTALRVGCDIRTEPFWHSAPYRQTTVTFVQSDASDLPFCPSVFDLVVCLAVIGEFPDWRAAIQAMAERVAPGGVLYVTVANARMLLRLYSFAERIGKSIPMGWWEYAQLCMRVPRATVVRGFDLPILSGWKYINVTPHLARTHQPLLRVIPTAWLSRVVDWIVPSFAYAWQRPVN